MSATANQLSYAKDLIAKRDLSQPPPTRVMQETLARVRSGDRVSGYACWDLITWLRSRPHATAAETPDRPRAPMVKPGCFILAGKIWVAHERRDKLGVWVEQLVEDVPDRIHDATGDVVNFELVYDRATSIRVVQDLTEEHRMTFAQARDYMIRYGQCFAPAGRSICGLRLKAADSVALAIGPVCGPKFPGYHEAVEELRASRKHALYEQARDELGIALTDVQLYRAAGPHVSTVAGIERKLDSTPALV